MLDVACHDLEKSVEVAALETFTGLNSPDVKMPSIVFMTLTHVSLADVPQGGMKFVTGSRVDAGSEGNCIVFV